MPVLRRQSPCSGGIYERPLAMGLLMRGALVGSLLIVSCSNGSANATLERERLRSTASEWFLNAADPTIDEGTFVHSYMSHRCIELVESGKIDSGKSIVVQLFRETGPFVIETVNVRDLRAKSAEVNVIVRGSVHNVTAGEGFWSRFVKEDAGWKDDSCEA